MTDDVKEKKKVGFAIQDPEKVKEWARQGGIAAQATGKAHSFTSEEARIAGRKGGAASGYKRRAARDGSNKS